MGYPCTETNCTDRTIQKNKKGLIVKAGAVCHKWEHCSKSMYHSEQIEDTSYIHTDIFFLNFYY